MHFFDCMHVLATHYQVPVTAVQIDHVIELRVEDVVLCVTLEGEGVPHHIAVSDFLFNELSGVYTLH